MAKSYSAGLGAVKYNPEKLKTREDEDMPSYFANPTSLFEQVSDGARWWKGIDRKSQLTRLEGELERLEKKINLAACRPDKMRRRESAAERLRGRILLLKNRETR